MESFGGSQEERKPSVEAGRPVPSGMEGRTGKEIELALKTLDGLVEIFKMENRIEDHTFTKRYEFAEFHKRASGGNIPIPARFINSYLENRKIRFANNSEPEERMEKQRPSMNLTGNALEKNKKRRHVSRPADATLAKARISIKNRAANDDTQDLTPDLFDK